MRIKEIHLRNFRRFTDLSITEIPDSARLIVLAGPNGVGKSSLFDGLVHWHRLNGSHRGYPEIDYLYKGNPPSNFNYNDLVTLATHAPVMRDPREERKWVYLRSAFRHEADFTFTSIKQLPSPLDDRTLLRTINADTAISENYQRLVMESVQDLFSETLSDDMTRSELRDRLIGVVRNSVSRVLPDLFLTGVGDPMAEGTFRFTKGTSTNFSYMNLSAGERAVFDLILDIVVKRQFFNNTIYCIDEPESHLNSRIQARLLDELYGLIPTDCQLIIATHSIGFMRRALEMYRERPGEVVFLDFGEADFDKPCSLTPIAPSRDLWARTLNVALGDLAALVAPERVVICEGRPRTDVASKDKRAEFDARCYRQIFAAEYPRTDWISVGSSDQVANDKAQVGSSIQLIVSGTEIIRLIDRDMRSEREIQDKNATGVRVLTRRSIESYLLADEPLDALCDKYGKRELKAEVCSTRDAILLERNTRDGKDIDDMKSSSGMIYTKLRGLLSLGSSGQDFQQFAAENLAPLITPGMSVYAELKQAIFGQPAIN